jgi:hypothetical protein
VCSSAFLPDRFAVDRTNSTTTGVCDRLPHSRRSDELEPGYAWASSIAPMRSPSDASSLPARGIQLEQSLLAAYFDAGSDALAITFEGEAQRGGCVPNCVFF